LSRCVAEHVRPATRSVDMPEYPKRARIAQPWFKLHSVVVIRGENPPHHHVPRLQLPERVSAQPFRGRHLQYYLMIDREMITKGTAKLMICLPFGHLPLRLRNVGRWGCERRGQPWASRRPGLEEARTVPLVGGHARRRMKTPVLI